MTEHRVRSVPPCTPHNQQRNFVLRLFDAYGGTVPIPHFGEIGVPLYQQEAWRYKALAGMEAALKAQAEDPTERKLAEAQRRIGELTMDNELLRERCRRAAGLLAASGSPAFCTSQSQALFSLFVLATSRVIWPSLANAAHQAPVKGKSVIGSRENYGPGSAPHTESRRRCPGTSGGGCPGWPRGRRPDNRGPRTRRATPALCPSLARSGSG